MKVLIKLSSISLFINIFLKIYSQETLDRVSLSNGTIVTDKGTLLRGAYVSTDWNNILPNREDITSIKNYGLNALHLYAECAAFQSPGERVNMVDSIVKWTKEDSIYLIITVGNCTSIDFDGDFTLDFWEFYAPRYKDEKHVIYEIKNEPYFGIPYSEEVIKMEKNAYKIIKENAPETHVMFFGYANLVNWEGVMTDINALGEDIDWSNASIGFHSYIMSPDDVDSAITFLKSTGYPIMSTEMPMIMIDNWESTLNFRQIEIHEKHDISYLLFMNPNELKNDAYYKDIIEDYNISWDPDFGNWPYKANQNGRIWNAEDQIEAEMFDLQGGEQPNGVVSYLADESYAGMIDNNDWLMFENVDFGLGLNYFEAYYSSFNNSGEIEIYIDSPNNEKIVSCNYESTGGWENWNIAGCQIDNISGIHSLYLKFKEGGFNLNWIKFSLQEFTIIDNSSIMHNTYFSIYPNPVNNEINIFYQLENDGIVEICIYNLAGVKSKTIIFKPQIKGQYYIHESADNLEQGLYFIQITTNSYSGIQKIIKY